MASDKLYICFPVSRWKTSEIFTRVENSFFFWWQDYCNKHTPQNTKEACNGDNCQFVPNWTPAPKKSPPTIRTHLFNMWKNFYPKCLCLPTLDPVRLIFDSFEDGRLT